VAQTLSPELGFALPSSFLPWLRVTTWMLVRCIFRRRWSKFNVQVIVAMAAGNLTARVAAECYYGGRGC